MCMGTSCLSQYVILVLCLALRRICGKNNHAARTGHRYSALHKRCPAQTVFDLHTWMICAAKPSRGVREEGGRGSRHAGYRIKKPIGINP
ncbi:hypothetical protein LZ32DRAFT_297386 [Colletotrichum eremochloae]|nr:hypothetical protein LZ32DRAFT_297386 [Colletotrichum eremochloae]